MYSGHVAELCILLVCIVAFFGYHIWLYNVEAPFMGLIRVPTTMSKARQVWTRSICADDKDVITGVQTIRNSLMTVTLFTVAAGYIGARAIPEILLTPDMIQQLNLIQVVFEPFLDWMLSLPDLHAVLNHMMSLPEQRPYHRRRGRHQPPTAISQARNWAGCSFHLLLVLCAVS